jgi:anti-sigma B factor antagonist
MDIVEEHTADVTIVDVKGRIDSASAKALEDKLTSLAEAGRSRLVIDLDQVDYISSAGFRVLLVAARLAEEANGTLSLCRLSPEVQKLFELAAFTDLFEIHPSRPKASTS